MESIRGLDNRVLFAINSFARHTGWLHSPMLAFAGYGVLVFGLLLAAGIVMSRHAATAQLAAAGWAGLATLVAVGVNQPITHLVHEARPYTTHPNMLLLASRSADYSFPSDHAVMAGAVAAGLWLTLRRLGVLAAVAALLMAFTRVYVGAHYPWDVVAGLVVGASVALLGWYALSRVLVPMTGFLRSLPGLRAVFGARDPGPLGSRTAGAAAPVP